MPDTAENEQSERRPEDAEGEEDEPSPGPGRSGGTFPTGVEQAEINREEDPPA